MFNSTSRYYTLETATTIAPDGREITYVRRRLLPRGENQTLLVEVEVSDTDRLDLIAHRTLGDPEQFWRIADANNAMNPADLTTEPGETVRVAMPKVDV